MPGAAGFLPELFRFMGAAAPQVPAAGLSRLTGLFAGRVKGEWLLKNQKLDVSVSSSDPAAFRFSVSDFGERGKLAPALREYAAGFGKSYDLAALDRFLEAGARFGQKHQTTFGLVWGTGQAAPRLKVYFEELPPAGSVPEKRALVREGFGLRGAAVPGVRDLPALAAVCLDLNHGGGRDFKFYYWRGSLAGIAAPKWQTRALEALAAEKNCFYYEMRGLESSRKKIYKVYEVGGITDFSPGLREICAFYAAAGHKPVLEKLLAYARLAREAGMAVIPVLFAAGDSAAEGGRTYDSYFCFKPRAPARLKR